MTRHRNAKLAHGAISNFLEDPSQWQAALVGTDAVYQLEQKFCKLLNKPYALTFSSATTAIFAVFSVLENQAQAVPCPCLTWGGSIAGILATGHRPHWLDVLPDGTMDPAQLEASITSETRAFLAVDLYGHPVGTELRQIADQHELLYIQDCASSFGAYVAEHHTGHLAHVAIFSFGFNKALFGGEGAVAVLDDRQLYERLIAQFHHPTRQRRDLPDRPTNEFGLNLRINPLAAVAANAVFDETLAEVARHRQECLYLLHRLADAGLAATSIPGPAVRPSFHTFTFEPAAEITDIETWLSRQASHWRLTPLPISTPLYNHQYYQALAAARQWPLSSCPIAEAHCQTRVALVKKEHGNNYREH